MRRIQRFFCLHLAIGIAWALFATSCVEPQGGIGPLRVFPDRIEFAVTPNAPAQDYAESAMLVQLKAGQSVSNLPLAISVQQVQSQFNVLDFQTKPQDSPAVVSFSLKFQKSVAKSGYRNTFLLVLNKSKYGGETSLFDAVDLSQLAVQGQTLTSSLRADRIYVLRHDD
jgi:hypothetical protein